MPNSVCHNVHLAIILAGGIPVFIDIDKHNLGIEIDDLKNYKNIDIIIAPHSYGNPCNIFKIKKYCNRNKIILIEDCAMVSNAKLKNKYYGNFGDFSIQSFGKDKILDLEYGGAVLNNNYELHKKMKSIISKINKINKIQLQEIKNINKNFKYIYNSFFLTKKFNDISKCYKNRILNKSKNLLFAIDKKQTNIIYKKIDFTNSLIKKKMKNFDYILNLFNKFKFKNIEYIKINKQAIPWRFNILILKNRNILFRKILDLNLPISSWYAPNNIFLSKKTNISNLKNSYDLANTILNIPLNQKKKYYVNLFNIIKEFENEKCL